MIDARSTFETDTMPYLESLYRTALRMVHDEAAAMRCIEETFLEAHRHAHRIPTGTDLRLWMFSTLFRKLRSFSSRPVSGIAGSDHDDILRAVDGIPALFREVLLLADVEGFRKDEIQAILQAPAELVTARLTEGRARLRHALQSGAPPCPPSGGNQAIAHGGF